MEEIPIETQEGNMKTEVPAEVQTQNSQTSVPAQNEQNKNGDKKDFLVWISVGMLALSLVTAGVFLAGRFVSKNKATPSPTATITSQATPSPSPDTIVGFICPKRDIIDCEPGPDNPELKWECTDEYLKWAGENCPGFRGAAF